MTYEEVKNLYNSNEFQETICHSKLCNYANTGCIDCEITHMNILINESMGKQIPKKPLNRVVGKWQVLEGECAECGTVIFGRDWFCPRCGQMIDWNEV